LSEDKGAEYLSPAVRKLLGDRELDPALIKGTGKAGRLTKGDVLAYLDKRDKEPAESPPSPSPSPPQAPSVAPESEISLEDRRVRLVPMTRIRARIAERLLEAQHNAAILTTFNEVNMQPVMDLRARHKEEFEAVHGARLGYMSFFAKAAVQALKRFPAINASIEGSNIAYHEYYDIGIAVGSPRGLVVPVLRDVDRLSFAAIEAKIAEFGEKAKKAQLTVEELSGGTFTISNGGIFGSLLSTPILNPPQSGILGMHKTQDRPIVEKGEILVRPMMNLALSYDHRIVDGREAVQFLVTVKAALEEPARLLLEL
jgi:2-oxoglutarate dehydrogenase E2 component (dihydrolipoamide succinyltransferase)